MRFGSYLRSGIDVNHVDLESAKKTSLTIALAGNPNSGKTSLFNSLTGSHYKVANYPGVTVERKTATVHLDGHNEPVTFIDLPGIYSLSSSSIDEKIATQNLLEDKFPPHPNLIVCVIDAANLERNLYLLTQLIDTGIPTIAALNMIDIAESRGIKVYDELLSRELKIPVVSISAKHNKGIDELKKTIINLANNSSINTKTFSWCPNQLFIEIANKLGHKTYPNRSEQIKTLIGFSILSESNFKDSIDASTLNEAKQQLVSNQIDPLSFEATSRYAYAREVCNKCIKRTASKRAAFMNKVDLYLTHPISGTIVFALIMAAIFQAIFTWAQLPMEIIDSSIGWVNNQIASVLPDGILKSLILDGVVAGVGSVLIFIPQIAFLFFFLGLLEDSGYLSRAAFLMDGIMRKVGLQGRSFIPLLSSFACAIPGIMSTRTIPSWSDRLTTILVAPLMSCSARLPIYTVLIAAMIPEQKVAGIFSLQALTMFSLYILGILGAAFVAWVLKKTLLSREPAFFIMELPPLRRPSFRLVFREIWDRIKLFCQSAGTVILACTIILWFLSSYPRTDENKAPELRSSYAGQIGSLIEPAIKPIGFNWEMGIGIIASFAAREVFVSALATIYNVEDNSSSSDGNDEYNSIIETLKSKANDGQITLASTLSLLVFYVFACQCMSTLAVTKRETGSWKWVAFMFIYMTALAYIMAFITYRISG